MELEMDCQTLRKLLQKFCSYKCQFCTNVWASSSHAGLSSSYDGWENVKKKYLMCQIPIKMLEQEAPPNSSLYNLKIYFIKKVQKN